MVEAINLIENFKVEKVIFNCGEFNDLENNLKNSKIYRTDEHGSIMFKIENTKLKIENCDP